MKRNAVDLVLLQLLVSVYNQSIQTYFYFPEVILCGRRRLDREEFDRLLTEELVMPFNADSFGQYYRLSKKGEAMLLQAFLRRRHHKPVEMPGIRVQPRLPFFEVG